MDTNIIPNIYSIAGSFAAVILLLLAVLFGLKKVYSLKPGINTDRRINLVEVLPLNNRQRLVLCSVKNQEVLLAVSNQAITPLAHWEDGITQLKAKNSGPKSIDNVSSKNLDQSSLKPDTKSEPDNQSRGEETINLSNSGGANTLCQLKDTNNLLLIAKKINKSLKANVKENWQ